MPRKRKPTILVVEDEAPLRKALVTKLTRDGYEVFAAENGEVGLGEALAVHPDIILLDLVMPVMDGFTMLEKLRKDDWGKDVPVMLLTNLAEYDSVAKAMEQEAYDYLVKSNWRLEDVIQKIEERLKKR